MIGPGSSLGVVKFLQRGAPGGSDQEAVSKALLARKAWKKSAKRKVNTCRKGLIEAKEAAYQVTIVHIERRSISSTVKTWDSRGAQPQWRQG